MLAAVAAPAIAVSAVERRLENVLTIIDTVYGRDR